jgi:signal transduction histidine kinase
MPKAHSTEKVESPSGPGCVNKDQPRENPQEAISTIGWFFASILHDLRNPLATISAGADLLIDLESPSTQVKRLAANMFHAAGRMQQLLADLASITRESTAEICDIREVIAAASEAALAAKEYQSVQILLDVPDGIALPLVRSHIERVLFNLIANAFEAMPGGGTVRIGARKTATSVLVELEDTGPGIPACIYDRLFEPFVTSGKEDGLGLGLALARQTVRNYGGDIWIEPAIGARFVIRLPLDSHLLHPWTGCMFGNVGTSIG